MPFQLVHAVLMYSGINKQGNIINYVLKVLESDGEQWYGIELVGAKKTNYTAAFFTEQEFIKICDFLIDGSASPTLLINTDRRQVSVMPYINDDAHHFILCVRTGMDMAGASKTQRIDLQDFIAKRVAEHRALAVLGWTENDNGSIFSEYSLPL